ncbi:MAG: hypothetical protein R3B07_02610 [Polyangiaceae bacterium]
MTTRKTVFGVSVGEHSVPALELIVERAQEAARKGLTPEQKREIREFVSDFHSFFFHIDDAIRRKRAALLRLIHPGDSKCPLDLDEPFGDCVAGVFDQLDPKTQAAWSALFDYARTATGAKPSKKWLKAAQPVLKQVGAAEFEQRLGEWTGFRVPEDAALSGDAEGFWLVPPISDLNADVLKGLIWIASLTPTHDVVRAVGDFGDLCFRKVKNHGAFSSKAGNACVWMLGSLDGFEGVAQLGRLEARVKYRQGQRLIQKAKEQAATRAGMTPDDLEELAAPTLDLDSEGRAENVYWSGDCAPRARYSWLEYPLGRAGKSARACAAGGEVEVRGGRAEGAQARAKDAGIHLMATRARVGA